MELVFATLASGMGASEAADVLTFLNVPKMQFLDTLDFDDDELPEETVDYIDASI